MLLNWSRAGLLLVSHAQYDSSGRVLPPADGHDLWLPIAAILHDDVLHSAGGQARDCVMGHFYRLFRDNELYRVFEPVAGVWPDTELDPRNGHWCGSQLTDKCGADLHYQ